jgi:cytidylate kinase
VCISGAEGSGAHEVAEQVATRLGFRLVDQGIVARAAREAGVDESEVADVERRKSALKRVLEGIGRNAGDTSFAMSGIHASVADEPSDGALRDLIRAAIEETAAQGDAVILAHAGSVALAGRDDVLRVLVTASPETRRRRYAAEREVEEAEAAKAVEKADAARADYLKRFYGIPSELSTHYDLVVNTDRLPPAQAAGLIVQATAESAAEAAVP